MVPHPTELTTRYKYTKDTKDTKDTRVTMVYAMPMVAKALTRALLAHLLLGSGTTRVGMQGVYGCTGQNQYMTCCGAGDADSCVDTDGDPTSTVICDAAR